MPLVIRYERDLQGLRRAVADAPYTPVGWYLQQDVQGFAVHAEEVLAAIDEVASGRLPSWEGTGNAHHLTLVADSALIESVWAAEVSPCRLPLSEFRDAVAGWLSFIRSTA